MSEINIADFAGAVNTSRLDLINQINQHRTNPISNTTSLQAAINIAATMLGGGGGGDVSNEYDLILNGYYSSIPTYQCDQIMYGAYIVEE